MSNQIKNATPRPWGVMYGKTLMHIETANLGDGTPCGMPVCSIPKKREADADLICRAVNLLAAHEAVAEAAKAFEKYYFDDLAKSNPGFLSKLTLQDYKAMMDASIGLPKALDQLAKLKESL